MLHLYAISLKAERLRPELPYDERLAAGPVTEHIPSLVMTESIAAAGAESREVALERWPRAEGWRRHQAVVQPVDVAFTNKMEICNGAGGLGDSAEAPEIFSFDSID